LTGKIFKKSK